MMKTSLWIVSKYVFQTTLMCTLGFEAGQEHIIIIKEKRVERERNSRIYGM